MTKPSRAVEHEPVIPPRRKSLLFMREHSKSAAFPFPDSHQLIITTPKGVFIWSKHGILPAFYSGTGGIVAARKTTEDGQLLAVADSQVVVLHDMQKGINRSYKLKGSDGHVRLLRYSQDTDSLFFTTTLQNAVQSYSLKQSKLLGPFCNHPSPPTVLALSPSSHLLLSASVAPPSIQLTNFLFPYPPILIRPRCSSSAVVAAVFHPERSNVFCLAFADGTCAMYDAARLARNGGNGDHQRVPAKSGTTGEISHIKRLHAIASSMPASELELGGLGYTNDGVGETGIGITAVAFVPGSRTKAVTVGADGKCCVVDFVTDGKKRGSVLRSWHIQGPATSLALLSSPFNCRSDNTEQNYAKHLNQPRRRVLVTIGRQDGKLLLYDLSGHLLQDRVVGLGDSRVIELEWTTGSVDPEVGQPEADFSGTPIAPFKQRKKSLGMISAGVPIAEVVPVTDGANDELEVPAGESLAERRKIKQISRRPYLAGSALQNLDCFTSTTNPSQGKERDGLQNPTVSSISDKAVNGQVKNSSIMRSEAYSKVPLSADGPSLSRPPPAKRDPVPLLPPFSPRPKTRKSSTPSIHRTRKRHQAMLGPIIDSHRDIQRVLGIDASAPRDLPRSSPTKRPDMAAMSHAATQRINHTSETAPDVKATVTPKPLDFNDGTGMVTSSQRPIRNLNEKPITIEKNRGLNALTIPQITSNISSEASSDIMIEWSPTSTQLVPTTLPHYLPEIPPRPKTSKDRKAPSPKTNSSDSNDTIVQWTSFKKGHIFNMHNNTSNRKPHLPSPPPLATAPPKNIPPSNPPPPETTTTTTTNPRSHTTLTTSAPPQPQPQPPSRTAPIPPQSREQHDGSSTGTSTSSINIKILREELQIHFQAQRVWFDGKLRELGRRMEEAEGGGEREVRGGEGGKEKEKGKGRREG